MFKLLRSLISLVIVLVLAVVVFGVEPWNWFDGMQVTIKEVPESTQAAVKDAGNEIVSFVKDEPVVIEIEEDASPDIDNDEQMPAEDISNVDSEVVEDQKPTVEYANATTNLQLSVDQTEGGVFLSWNAFSGDKFKSYYVVRSESSQDPFYPNYGSIAETSDRLSTVFVDQVAEKGVNYNYRICAETSEKVFCGNVVEFKY